MLSVKQLSITHQFKLPTWRLLSLLIEGRAASADGLWERWGIREGEVCLVFGRRQGEPREGEDEGRTHQELVHHRLSARSPDRGHGIDVCQPRPPAGERGWWWWNLPVEDCWVSVWRAWPSPVLYEMLRELIITLADNSSLPSLVGAEESVAGSPEGTREPSGSHESPGWKPSHPAGRAQDAHRQPQVHSDWHLCAEGRRPAGQEGSNFRFACCAYFSL